LSERPADKDEDEEEGGVEEDGREDEEEDASRAKGEKVTSFLCITGEEELGFRVRS
jgi:hypothetical protein